jgi:hypothetical protein
MGEEQNAACCDMTSSSPLIHIRVVYTLQQQQATTTTGKKNARIRKIEMKKKRNLVSRFHLYSQKFM